MKKKINLKKINILLTVALIALVTQLPITTTQAGGPLAKCSSGVPFLWPNGGANIPFNPDQGELGTLTNPQAVAAVQQAFDVWANVPSSTVTYANAGPLPVDVTIANFLPYFDAPAPDGRSAIVFDDTGQIFTALFGPGSGVLGFAGPEWGNGLTCTITEGYSFLNGPEFTDPTYALDVMVHEFGHYTNLSHTVVNGQIFIGDDTGPSPNDTFGGAPSITTIETMYPFYFGPTSGTNTLHKDDIASLSTLYPEATFATSTGAISGVIFAPNGTTKLTGVNVIARNIADPFNDAVSAISSDFTDGTAQSDPVVGTYKIEGLTPGAQYAIYVDQILDGGFSTTPLGLLPGPEEFYNGANESNNGATDNPASFTGVAVTAGNMVSGTNIIFNSPTPGVPLPVGDDGSVELSLPFNFTICGQTYSSVFVNANGNLTFGAPNGDFSETAAEFLSGPPRIAGLWDDLNASAGGTVVFNVSKNTFTVAYNNVPEFINVGSNSFSITLKRSANHIDIAYGNVSAVDGIGGVSCGGAITSRFETPVDLSSFGTDRINLHKQPAAFEVWNTANPFDLDNKTVFFTGTTDYNDNWAGHNDTLAHARQISVPFSSVPIERYTEIEPTGADVDFFRFELEAGKIFVAEIKTGNLDSLIRLYDAAGNPVATDDDSGVGVLSFLMYPVPVSGTYYLGVTTFPDTDFTGDGASGGRYVLDLIAADEVALPLGDDTSQQVNLGFTFPYQGTNYTSLFVNSNGNLTFGVGSTDLSETVPEFLNGPPRIAPLWDDLNPAAGGSVIFATNAGGAAITFNAVPEFLASTTNTFTVRLYPSGQIDLVYGIVSAVDGLVGITQGGGVPNPGATNLSAAINLSATGTTYELFNAGNPNDMSGRTLVFSP